MLIMKYTIILGFFATISAVSAIQSGNTGFQRVRYPERWLNALKTCYQYVSHATVMSFATYSMETATPDSKCLALCVYTESGVFVDGRFDPSAIEIFLRKHIGPHYLLEKVVKMFKAAADAGNAKVGGNADKVYAYHTTFGTLENHRIWNAIFRQVNDS